MRKITISPALLLIVVVMLSGCVQNTAQNNEGSYADEGTLQDEEGPYAGEETSQSQIYFYAYTLPDAVVGVPYNYSFCDPAPTNVNDLCGALEDSNNPNGGNHPYHFTLGSGIGFQQFGLLLNLNGLLAGTPTTTGTRTFNVCAVDLSGNQECDNVTLTVVPSYALTMHKTGSGSGTMTIKSVFGREKNKEVNCSSDCTLSFRNDTSISIISTPDAGSAFDGFAGDCVGTDKYYNTKCWITMNKDADASANFEKLGLTVTSATCRYNTEVGYNYLVIVQGTATGPKSTTVSIDTINPKGRQGSAFYDIGYACGTWDGGMFWCGNGGAYGTSTWSWTYKIYGEAPFTYIPTVTLKADNGAPLTTQPTMYCQ